MSSDRHDSATAEPRLAGASRRRAAALAAGFGALLVVGAALLTGAGPAAAASTIIEIEPANGSTVGPNDVSAVVVRFSQAAPAGTGVVLTCDSNPILDAPAELSADGMTLTLPVQRELPTGRCNVGVLLAGNPTFSFTVSASAAAAPTTAEAVVTPAPEAVASAALADASTLPIWLGRTLSTFGVAVFFGALVLIVAAWPEGPEYVLALRFLRGVWIVGIVGTAIYVSAWAGLVNGSTFSFNPGEWFELLDAGWPGRAALVRLALVAACGWVMIEPARVLDSRTSMGALGLPALAVVTLGLSRTGGQLAAIGLLASVVHVLAMAVWLGGVVLLARVVLAGPGDRDLVDAVHGFGRISSVAIAATAVTGIVQLYRIDGSALFTSTHGRIMLLKVLAVLGMIYVGLTARQIARAKLRRTDELSVRTADRLKRAFGTEAAVGLLILGLTSWMLNQAPGKIDGPSSASGRGAAATNTFARRQPVRVSSPSGAVLLEMEIAAHPARVGANTIRVVVTRPEAGLTGLTLTFSPPSGMGGTTETVINLAGLAGKGVAQTSNTALVNFDVAGPWTVTVTGATVGEPFTTTTVIDVATVDGQVQQPQLPSAMTTVASTAPPTTPPAGTETTQPTTA